MARKEAEKYQKVVAKAAKKWYWKRDRFWIDFGSKLGVKINSKSTLPGLLGTLWSCLGNPWRLFGAPKWVLVASRWVLGAPNGSLGRPKWLYPPKLSFERLTFVLPSSYPDLLNLGHPFFHFFCPFFRYRFSTQILMRFWVDFRCQNAPKLAPKSFRKLFLFTKLCEWICCA